MKTLILTLDYELYGNGSGDVFKNIIEPTNHILSILRQYNIHISIFFEVVEYWKIKEEWDKGNKMGYENNPIEAINDQLRKAYVDGHDIQLHIHPQWVDAKYIDGKWHVNLNEWRLGDYHREGEYSLKNLLLKGKQTIEDIIRPIDPEYKCIALRAGGYNAQPSQDIVRAMNEVGLQYDTSIFPGGERNTALSKFNYKSIPIDLGIWNTGCNLEVIGNSSIKEVPIVSFPIRRIAKYLNFERIQATFSNTKSAKDAFENKTNASHGFINKIKFFFEEEYITWDFCLFTSGQHKLYLKKIKQLSQRTIFVLIGHSKSFVNGNSLKFLINNTGKDFQYITFSEISKLSI